MISNSNPSKDVFTVCCNTATLVMYRLLTYHHSTQRTASYRNAAAVDYEHTLRILDIHPVNGKKQPNCAGRGTIWQHLSSHNSLLLNLSIHNTVNISHHATMCFVFMASLGEPTISFLAIYSSQIQCQTCKADSCNLYGQSYPCHAVICQS